MSNGDYYRLHGARLLLSAFEHEGIPADVEERDEALEPAIRALWAAEQRGGRTLYEVAEQLRSAADVFASGSEHDLPEQVENFPRNTSPVEMPAVLREIADHVDFWKRGHASKLATAIPTSWELSCRFPQLNELLDDYFGQIGVVFDSDEELTGRQGLQLFIETCHRYPLCLWRLPQVAAECHEALATFQTEESLRRFFEAEHRLNSMSLPWTRHRRSAGHHRNRDRSVRNREEPWPPGTGRSRARPHGAVGRLVPDQAGIDHRSWRQVPRHRQRSQLATHRDSVDVHDEQRRAAFLDPHARRQHVPDPVRLTARRKEVLPQLEQPIGAHRRTAEAV